MLLANKFILSSLFDDLYSSLLRIVRASDLKSSALSKTVQDNVSVKNPTKAIINKFFIIFFMLTPRN